MRMPIQLRTVSAFSLALSALLPCTACQLDTHASVFDAHDAASDTRAVEHQDGDGTDPRTVPVTTGQAQDAAASDGGVGGHAGGAGNSDTGKPVPAVDGGSVVTRPSDAGNTAGDAATSPADAALDGAANPIDAASTTGMPTAGRVARAGASGEPGTAGTLSTSNMPQAGAGGAGATQPSAGTRAGADDAAAGASGSRDDAAAGGGGNRDEQPNAGSSADDDRRPVRELIMQLTEALSPDQIERIRRALDEGVVTAALLTDLMATVLESGACDTSHNICQRLCMQALQNCEDCAANRRQRRELEAMCQAL